MIARTLLVLGLLLPMVAADAAPSAAQNLLANPDFDGSLAWWDHDPRETWFSGLDAGHDPASGSMVSLGTSGAAWQWVPVTPGQQFDFGARISLAAGADGGTAVVAVEWLDLQSQWLAADVSPWLDAAQDPLGVWVPAYARATAPPGAAWAQVILGTNRAATRFDGAVFGLAGTVALPLFVNGFDYGDASGWSSTQP